MGCTFRDGPTTQGTSARAGLAAALGEFARVLRRVRLSGKGPGRAVLLVQSRKLVLDALEIQRAEGAAALILDEGVAPNPRHVVIGGFACWIFVLHRSPAAGAEKASPVEEAASSEGSGGPRRD